MAFAGRRDLFGGESNQVQAKTARRLRQAALGACIVFVGAAVLVGFRMGADAAISAAEACPNEAIRMQQGTAELPDCRAYEMVTPAPKGSGEPEAGAPESSTIRPDRMSSVGGVRAGLDGERMAWISEPLPGARAPGLGHLSTRTAAGWTSEDVVPPMTPFNDLLCPLLMGVSAWSPNLTHSVLDLPAGAPAGFKEEEECGQDEPRLVSGEPEHFRNLFVRDNLTGSYRLVNVTPEDVVWPKPEETLQRYWPASFLAASDDLTHVVFEEELALTDDAPIGYRGGDELYESVGGQVRLVTVLPDETPVHGSLAGATRNYAAESDIAGQQATNLAQFRHAVSADGARIYFEAEGGLYLRENGSETFQVDVSHGLGPSGGGKFMLASADGSRVFFTDENRLTPDSTANPGEPDLYEYRAGEPGSLEDLTVSSGEAANVLGVSGASENGDRVYFVARGALTTAPNSAGDTAVPGEPNLYLAEAGALVFIATLDSFADNCDWTADAHCGGAEEAGPSLTARVSRDGNFLGFNSVHSLTGYDNADAGSGEPDFEIFLFDAAAKELRCASCNPTGAPPVAGAAIPWPSNPGRNGSWSNAYPQRSVSDRGQVFFDTVDALVPRDGNGVRDVYEYFEGSLRLLSTGGGESGFRFLDATPDGGNVFVSTAQSLLGSDRDAVTDYYDVRAGGGFSEPPPPPPPCNAGSCRAGGSPMETAPPAGTSSFVGSGNPRPRHRCRTRHHKRGTARGADRSGKRRDKADSRAKGHCRRIHKKRSTR